MAEGARLESVYTGNRIEGSNPSPSASQIFLLNYGLKRRWPGPAQGSGRMAAMVATRRLLVHSCAGRDCGKSATASARIMVNGGLG